MTNLRLRSAAFALAVAGVSGCSDALVEVGGELSLELAGAEAIELADSLIVEFEVRGRSLLGLALEYGDGVVDSVGFAGAQSAGGRLAHLYGEGGTYTVVGEVQDGVEGTIVRQFTLVVRP